MSSLFRTFTVQGKSVQLTGRGRVATTGWTTLKAADGITDLTLRGILADTTPSLTVKMNQTQHPETVTIAQKGPPIAAPGQRLLYNGRRYAVTTVQDPGELHKWTIYACMERYDDSD